MLIQMTHGLVLKLPLGWLFTMIQKNKTNGPYGCILCKNSCMDLVVVVIQHNAICSQSCWWMMGGKNHNETINVLTSNQTREEMRWQGGTAAGGSWGGKDHPCVVMRGGGESSSHRAETVYKLNPRRNEPNVLWRTQQRCKQADCACAAKCRAWTVRAGANQKMSKNGF